MQEKPKNYLLWTIQVLLALVFLFSGGSKLVLPIEVMTAQIPLAVPFPGLSLRFLGTVEVLGAIGLVLPWMLKIKPFLTSLSAIGFVIIMLGATVINLMYNGVLLALIPLVVGALAAIVAYGRWQADYLES